MLLAIVDTAFQTPAEDNESRRERARGALAIVLASVPLRELPMNSQQKIASLIPDAKSLPYTLDANPNSEYMCMQGEYRLSKVIPYNGVVLVDNQMLVKTMYGKVIGVSLNWAMTADGKIVVPGVWYSAGFEIGSTTAEAAIAASDQGNLRISLNTDKRYHWSCSRNLTNSHLPDTDIYDLITRTVAELPQNVSPIMTGLLGELTTREAFGGRGRRLRQVESL